MMEKLKRLQELQCYNGLLFNLVTFVTFLTWFTRNRLSSPPRSVYRHSAERLSRDVRCTAWVHLLVIRAERARRARRKYFSECGSRLPHRLRRTACPVRQSRHGVSWQPNRKSPFRPA